MFDLSVTSMALAFIYTLQNIWPLSIFKFDDLRASNQLVGKLSLPENTKEFVFAVRDQKSQSVIYILCVQNLSERSAFDVERLIREVRPEAVVAQVGHSSCAEVHSEESELGVGADESVPTSSFGVIKRCFLDKINKESYECVAGNLVLKEIFGVGFHGHLLVAKKVAKEVGSSFLLLDSPLVRESRISEVEEGGQFQGLINSLVPQKVGSVVSSSSKRFVLTDDVQARTMKLLSSHMDASVRKLTQSSSVSDAGLKEIQPDVIFDVPPFAQSIYPLLMDLHSMFIDLPSIGRALAFSQKMLHDISKGEAVDAQIMSEVYTFRVAVEWLRITLNRIGRFPIKVSGNSNPFKVEFEGLSVEDKSHVLLAQALQSQSQKFRTIVAVVDASSLAGLRKYWKMPVPLEVKDMVAQLLDCENDELSNHTQNKRLLTGKSMVAVGAGATAAVAGASSFSKFVPASTLMKAITFKVPTSLKIFLTQTEKIMSLTLGNPIAPAKALAPGLANSGASATSVLKTAASAEKIRVVVHSVIASVEKTSFSAMRSAFYEIMRKRRVKPIGILPWTTFGCSIATCSTLLMFGDGIECAVESVPTAHSIASLGRGIQKLRQTSKIVGQTDGGRIQKAIESLMYRLRNVKIQ